MVQSSGVNVIARGKTTPLSVAELRALTRVEVRVSDEGDSATLSGPLLWDVLQKVSATSAQASGRQRASSYVKVTGGDGISAVIALVEIDPSFSKRTVIIADQRNGKPLDAVEGPWRVIVPDDIRHARWIRNLKSVTVDTVRR